MTEDHPTIRFSNFEDTAPILEAALTALRRDALEASSRQVRQTAVDALVTWIVDLYEKKEGVRLDVDTL